MSDIDFEEQIRLERETRLGIVSSRPTEEEKETRTESDGTVMEFDEEKRAWFPKVNGMRACFLKIDDDFIARYQMSYGTNALVTDADSAVAPFVCSLGPPPPQPQPSRTYTDAESEEYWGEYNTQCRERYRTRRQTQAETQGEIDSDEEQDKQLEDKQNDEYDYTAYYTYYHKQRTQELDEYNLKHNIKPTLPSVEAAQTVTQANDEVLTKTGDAVTDEFWKGYFRDKGEYIKPEEEEEAVDDTENNKETDAAAKKRKEDDDGWFDSTEQQVTSVYVQGLPDDIEEDELRTIMSRCGLIASDPRTKKMKVKLYTDKDGKVKGDGLCTYIKPESVALAVQFIDGSEVRGHVLKIEPAKFKMKGNFDPTKKKKKLANKEKNKHRKHQAKLFDWKLESDEVAVVKLKHERTVIVKNAFDPATFEGNMLLINQTRDNLRTECSKYGEVKKVLIFDRHTDGVASILFKDSEEADKCVTSMDNRFLGRRLLQVCIWNGTTRYEVEETEDERDKRNMQWNTFLDDDDSNKENVQKPVAKPEVVDLTSEDKLEVDGTATDVKTNVIEVNSDDETDQDEMKSDDKTDQDEMKSDDKTDRDEMNSDDKTDQDEMETEEAVNKDDEQN